MAFGKPKTPLTPEQQLQRRQNIGVGLAALSESLRGGDPVGRTLGLMEQFEQKDLDKQLDDAIDMSNLPESQKKLMKSLSVQAKTQALMQAYQPPKITTDKIRAALLKKINDFGYDSLTTNEKETLAQIQNLDPFERRTRGLGRTPGTFTGARNDVQDGYIDTGETTPDGKKIFKDQNGNKFVDPGS